MNQEFPHFTKAQRRLYKRYVLQKKTPLFDIKSPEGAHIRHNRDEEHSEK